VKHAARISYRIDTSALVLADITPLRDYGKVQRYGKSLPGDYDKQVRDGWAAKNKKLSNSDVFIDQLPSKLLARERPYVIILELPPTRAENPVLPAHRDYNKTCGINIYLETNGEVTKFYNWNRDTRACDFIEEFCAASGETWIMNTDVPHSVILVPNKARRMLSLCFTKLSYDEVLECFQTN